MIRFRPRARFGLRARITLAMGLGAALLSILVAGITWGLTRENLLSNRESNAVQAAAGRAVDLTDVLTPDLDTQGISAEVNEISTPEGSLPLLRKGEDQWFQRSAKFAEPQVNESLLAALGENEAARMRYDIAGTPFLVIGIRLEEQGALYFEAVNLGQIESALNGLAISLLGAGAVTTIAGFAIGFYASGRTLKPLKEVGTAAEAIADGDLDTRLEAGDDPDLRPLTDSFNDMVTALQSRIERDARFASEVSHELRSPLMTLTASVEVLQNNRDDFPDRARTALDLLSHDIVRFQQLVEDLLEISRFDAGAIRLDLTTQPAGDTTRAAVAELTGGKVPVTVDDSVNNLFVRIDRRRFAQILANLLVNADRYGDHATGVIVDRTDGIPSSENVPGDPEPDVRVRIAVQDNGPGVPEEDRSVIFDRFSRGGTGGRRGDDLGTGLGLALVSEHVGLHGGRVYVEDKPDGEQGARFVIELPAFAAVSKPSSEEGTDEALALAATGQDEDLA